MPRLILSQEDRMDFMTGEINAQQLIGACLEEGIIDEANLGKILGSTVTAMFAMYRGLEMPEQIIRSVLSGDAQALKKATDYLRASEVPEKERALKGELLVLVINIVALSHQLGGVIMEDDKLPGKQAPIKKL